MSSQEHSCQKLPGIGAAAVQAYHLVEAAMEVHDVDASGLLVQPVHVLGDEAGKQAPPLQINRSPVALVGISLPEVGPADMVPCPVALTVGGSRTNSW